MSQLSLPPALRRFAALGVAATLITVPMSALGLPVASAADSAVHLSRPEVTPSRVALFDDELYLPVPELEPPADLDDAVAVATTSYPYGDNSAAAVRADGTVVAWGSNRYGQTDVPAGLDDVVKVDLGGGFGLALRADGSVVAWGDNASGVLDVPADLGPVIDIAAGGTQTGAQACGYALALRADHTVARWGGARSDGTCRTLNQRYDPPAGLRDVAAISAGDTSAVARKTDGTVAAWGPSYSANGNGIRLARWRDVVDVKTRGGRYVATRADGQALTDGFISEALYPPLPDDVVRVAAGLPGAMLRSDGSITTVAPNPYTTDPGFQAVAAGYYYLLAIAAPEEEAEPEPEPTPTETTTAEPTETATAEPTPTETATTEPTPTEPTPTETASAEPTPTETATAEPTPTETATAEPTPTETATTEPTPTETATAEPAPTGPALGSDQVQPYVDGNPSGQAEAFRSVALRDTDVASLRVFLDETSTAGSLMVGVYSDANGEPGRLISSGRTRDLVAGDWNTISVDAVSLKAGQAYWLALASPVRGGIVRFRDHHDGDGGATRTSRERKLTWRSGLPVCWTSADAYANAPASFHVVD